MTTTEQLVPDLEVAVDESVQEALLLADLFRKVHQEEMRQAPELNLVSFTNEQLEQSRQYLQQPLSVEVFARTIKNIRRPRS